MASTALFAGRTLYPYLPSTRGNEFADRRLIFNQQNGFIPAAHGDLGGGLFRRTFPTPFVGKINPKRRTLVPTWLSTSIQP